MVAFDDEMALAMGELFSADFADTVIYNGSETNAHIQEYGAAEDGRAQFDYVDVEFQNADVASLNYRDDVLTVAGVTWRYPKIGNGDAYTTTIRWRRNERPVIR